MAKAHIQTPDGVSVQLEGTAAEISAVLKDVKVKAHETPARKAKAKTKGGKVTITGLVEDLRIEGFFKKPKGMGDIKKRLSEMGHTYPLTALSGPLRTEVRQRRLRRFKEKGKYVYAQ